MKIQLWSIGKPHDKELKTAIDQFTQRCNNYFPVEWHIIAPPKNAGVMNENELKKKEGELVLQLLDKLETVEGDKKDREVKAFLDAVGGIRKLGRQADKTLDTMVKAEETWFVSNLLKLFK